MLLYCKCGKLCTSKTGLLLHQRRCILAKEAISKGIDPTKSPEVLVLRDYNLVAQKFLILAESIAGDITLAAQSNKSAGRRARRDLLEIGKDTVKLRKYVLKYLNNKEG
jgi:hypothetical protein